MRRFLPMLLAVLLAHPASSSAVTRSNPDIYSSGGISLKLTEPAGSIYRSGENVRFSFITKQDAYVIIFDIDTDGYVHLLYPVNGMLSQKSVAGKKYVLPDYDEASLVVSGPTGIELVFALAVPDRAHINEEELSFLTDNENLPMDKKFRIDGDPLLAANTISSELVRNISQLEGVSLAYTYFYINDRVEYPRYVCSECHQSKADPYTQPCTAYEFGGPIEPAEDLAYPLQRGFEAARLDARDDEREGDNDRAVEVQTDQPETNIYVSFYPYDSYIYSPRTLYSFYTYDPWYWAPLWTDPWWGWDPFYPGYSGFSFYSAWGWNWGSWGWGYGYPYNYGSWWYPYRHYPRHHYDDYYYGDYAYRPYRPHQTRYKNDLFAATARNASRDPDMLINSVRYKGDRNSPDRFYKAKAAGDRTRTLRTDANHRSKSALSNRDRLNDGSRTFIQRDKTYIHNDRRSKSRSSSSYTPRQKTRTDAQVKPRSYRMRDGNVDTPKSRSRTRGEYKPESKGNTSPPSKAKARTSTQIRRDTPSRTQSKAVNRSSSGSGKSQATQQRSNQSSGKKKSRN